MGAISSGAGVIGMVLGMPSNWFQIYQGAYYMQYMTNSTGSNEADQALHMEGVNGLQNDNDLYR